MQFLYVRLVNPSLNVVSDSKATVEWGLAQGSNCEAQGQGVLCGGEGGVEYPVHYISDEAGIVKSEPCNHHVRNLVIFIVLWSIAVVLWLSLPLMASGSLNYSGGTSVCIGWSVIGLFLVILGVGTVRSLQLPAEVIPVEDKDQHLQGFRENTPQSDLQRTK